MWFPFSAYFREPLSASIAVANVVSPRNLVHVSIGRHGVGTTEPTYTVRTASDDPMACPTVTKRAMLKFGSHQEYAKIKVLSTSFP